MNRCPAMTEQIIPYCPDITEQKCDLALTGQHQVSTHAGKGRVSPLGGFECRFCFGIAGLHVAIQFQAVDHAQRFFPRCFQRLHSNLDKRIYFHAVAGPVGADGFLPHFGKEERIVARTFGTRRATSCRRQ